MEKNVPNEVVEIETLLEITPEKLNDPLAFLDNLDGAKKEIAKSESIIAEMKQKLSVFRDDMSQTVDTHRLAGKISERENRIKQSRDQINKAKTVMTRCKAEKEAIAEEINKVSDWLEHKKEIDQSESEEAVDEVDAISAKDVDSVEQSIDLLSVNPQSPHPTLVPLEIPNSLKMYCPERLVAGLLADNVLTIVTFAKKMKTKNKIYRKKIATSLK